MAVGCLLTVTALLLAAPARAARGTSQARTRALGPAIVRDGHARFEVLSPTLIRLEYAADDRFEDSPTMTAVNRSSQTASFATFVQGSSRVVRTSALTLRYQRDSGPFGEQNLSIDLHVGGVTDTVQPSWQPDSNPQNLGGWRRALDNELGPVPLHQGLLSRAGWYLLNDTQTVLLTDGSPGFSVRPAHVGAYQDGYFFGYGHDYVRALADLRALTGPAPLPPRKAFGVWFSRYYAYSASDYPSLLAQFHANGVPLDTLSIDTDWKRESNPTFAPAASTAAGGSPTQPYAWDGWEWNTTAFPDPASFLAWAHGQGLAVALNVHPSINGDDPQFPATNAAAGGLAQDSGTCRILVATPDGCYVFNWADARQLNAYFALHEPIESNGVDLWWLDWCCDGSSAQAPGLSADTWINSRYALRSQQRGSRWPVLSRIGGSFQGPGTDGDDSQGDNGAGVFAEHRYSIHFTGDTCATWPMLAFESHFTPAEGNVGLPYVSHDIGSFNGAPVAGQCQAINKAGHLPDDIYVRWVQLGTFQPLDRLHSNHGDRLPWDYGGKAGSVAADFLRLREALVPYLYTLARQAYDTGLPMVRDLYLQWPEQADAYRNPGEYTLGADVLVAPVTAAGDPASTTVWIPPGDWIDYFTGARYAGPATLDLSVPWERMPVFVRAGAIIPTQPDLPTTATGPQDPLILTAWPGASGAFELYDDQGQGLGYQSSAYTRTRIDHTDENGISALTIEPAQGGFTGAPSTRSWEVRFAGVDRPHIVTLNGYAIPETGSGTAGGWWYQPASRTVLVRTGELSTTLVAKVTAGPRIPCLKPHLPVTRDGVGPVALGGSSSALRLRAGTPVSEGGGVLRWCVDNGGDVFAVLGGRTDAAHLVASTAPGSVIGRISVGAKWRRTRAAYPGLRPISRHLYSVRRPFPLLLSVRRGRVRYIAVVKRRDLSRPRRLRRYLRDADLG